MKRKDEVLPVNMFEKIRILAASIEIQSHPHSIKKDHANLKEIEFGNLLPCQKKKRFFVQVWLFYEKSASNFVS